MQKLNLFARQHENEALPSLPNPYKPEAKENNLSREHENMKTRNSGLFFSFVLSVFRVFVISFWIFCHKKNELYRLETTG